MLIQAAGYIRVNKVTAAGCHWLAVVLSPMYKIRTLSTTTNNSTTLCFTTDSVHFPSLRSPIGAVSSLPTHTIFLLKILQIGVLWVNTPYSSSEPMDVGYICIGLQIPKGRSNANPLGAEHETHLNAKWPFKVIQCHLFRCKWRATKPLHSKI